MKERLAYIIMPVGSDKAFESKRAVLEASASRHGWVFHFPMSYNPSINDKRKTQGDFELSEVIASMREASLVIADLSLERPSCYYELGVAQTLGRPTFLLAAFGTVIHQVAHRERVHFYEGLTGLSEVMNVGLANG
jgi:nucleoside 2-deoxyribosyltransferase